MFNIQLSKEYKGAGLKFLLISMVLNLPPRLFHVTV